MSVDAPPSPKDHHLPAQELFWLEPTSDNASSFEMDDQWTRSPFEMDDFTLPDFPPPRLTCPLVPLRRATPPKAEPLAPPQPQPRAQSFPTLDTQSYQPGQYYHPTFGTTLLPQAQAFSLNYHNSIPTPKESTFASFGDRYESICPTIPHRPVQLNCDISRTLSNAKYSELFSTCGAQLLVDRHPQFTLQDINTVLKTGYIYFLKNVKTIVPRIGQEWRFISHVRAPGPGESSDRSYNLLGPIPLRCKVKEWLVGGDLWRMYHFVQGKTTKQSMVH